MNKYIEFREIKMPAGRKTKWFAVVNKHSQTVIGDIYWYPAWRQFIFEPIAKTIWSWDCLLAVSNFIKGLMDERRNNVKL
jgi:hypothetical protein